MKKIKNISGITHFSLTELLGPALILIVFSCLIGFSSASLMLTVQLALCYFVMVLALQVFVGNSGVLSFGHGAFAMLGAFVSGLLTAPVRIKNNALSMTDLLQSIADIKVNLYLSLLIAAIVGGAVAGITGVFLMRLNGLAAGIATFALLGVAYNFFFNNTKFGPGSQALPGVPKFQNLFIPLLLALLALVLVYLLNVSSIGRTLRATREDNLAAPALGINIIRVRRIAFALSGALAGLAGAMYSHVAGTVQVQDYYLGFTFLTLSMLVIGGSGSIWGALVGTLLVISVGQVLLMMEQGKAIFGLSIDLPNGARAIFIAATLVVALLWRSSGVTNGKEFAFPNFKKKSN